VPIGVAEGQAEKYAPLAENKGKSLTDLSLSPIQRIRTGKRRSGQGSGGDLGGTGTPDPGRHFDTDRFPDE
jgi:hypothetical protein